MRGEGCSVPCALPTCPVTDQFHSFGGLSQPPAEQDDCPVLIPCRVSVVPAVAKCMPSTSCGGLTHAWLAQQ